MLSKNSIQGIGITVSLAAVAVTGFLFVKPFHDDTQEMKTTLQEQQTVTASKTAKLTQLEKGVDNIEESQKRVDRFIESSPNNMDIESASRAISNAAISGINITAFTFGKEENIEKKEPPKASLGEYVPPMDISEDTAAAAPAEEPAATDGSNGDEAATGEQPEKEQMDAFRRVPVQITVTADSYKKLSQYTDKLAEQKRLLYVVSINSTKGAGGVAPDGSATDGGSVEATIYAYAFIYGGGQ